MVCAVPEDSAALADRLGRYLPGDHDPVSLDVEPRRSRAGPPPGGAAQQEPSAPSCCAATPSWPSGCWGVRVGGVDLADVPIDAVRERILVSDTRAWCSPAPCRPRSTRTGD